MVKFKKFSKSGFNNVDDYVPLALAYPIFLADKALHSVQLCMQIVIGSFWALHIVQKRALFPFHKICLNVTTFVLESLSFIRFKLGYEAQKTFKKL